jgi:GTP cyclohydrolase I
MPVDRDAAAGAIRAFLEALGLPVAGPLAGTPKRVVDAWADELLSGYGVDVDALLAEGVPPAESATDDDVVIADIAVSTVCPHHLLPGVGRATVAYRPGARLLGIGAVARTVDALARRLTLQEDVGRGVVQALCSAGGARGALCRIELLHTCLAARGSRQHAARVVTVARAGEPLDPGLLTRDRGAP